MSAPLNPLPGQTFGDHACHSERSERSLRSASQILRFAQDDRQDLSPVRSRESSLQMSLALVPIWCKQSGGLHQALFGSQGVWWISCGENRLRYSLFSSVFGGWPV